MDAITLERARLWAALASARGERSPEKLSALERSGLIRALAAEIPRASGRSSPSEYSADYREKYGERPRQFFLGVAEELLPLIQGIATETLAPLIYRGKATRMINRGTLVLTWSVTGAGQFTEKVSIDFQSWGSTFLAALRDVLRADGGRFPFGVCPECKTIFARRKRQRFCSPNCTYVATERARPKREARNRETRKRLRRAHTEKRLSELLKGGRP